MVIDEVKCNGYPVIFTLELVTEPEDGFTGSRYCGAYPTLQELNKAINAIEVPLHWMLKIDFQEIE